MFSTVFSVAVLASAAMAAPQYYYPAAPQYYYNGAVAQPAAGAALGYALPGAAAAVPALPAAANQAVLNDQLAGLAALVPQLKELSALSVAQAPATNSAISSIAGASASLLNKVPLETIPPTLRGDIEILIGATQQLIGQNNVRKPLADAELAKVIAASNSLLQALPSTV